MTRNAPRSINDYLQQLREVLAGEDPALIQDALYDAEEYLRAEVAANRDKSEADVLELIASTYGAPEEVGAAYRENETKVKAALESPPPRTASGQLPGALRRFFGIYVDPRAYMSLFFMLLSLATGIIYFTVAVTGLSLSVGLAVVIVGVPFFLTFIGMTRVMALGEGRLLEAITGERMPRRPVHPGPPQSFWARIGEMLKDARTWTTLVYFILMLPVGICYFTVAVVGLALGVAFTACPILDLADRFGWLQLSGVGGDPWINMNPHWLGSPIGLVFVGLLGVLILTLLMHLARGVGRVHARIAKYLLVARSH
jgi:Putative sensor